MIWKTLALPLNSHVALGKSLKGHWVFPYSYHHLDPPRDQTHLAVDTALFLQYHHFILLFSLRNNRTGVLRKDRFRIIYTCIPILEPFIISVSLRFLICKKEGNITRNYMSDVQNLHRHCQGQGPHTPLFILMVSSTVPGTL